MATRRFQYSLQALFALVLFAAVGTAVYRWATMPTAMATGTIVFNDSPLAGGEIAFVNVNGGGESKSVIARDGQFQIGLFPGDYNVCIRGPAGGAISVPAQYGNTATTDLKASVRKGQNQFLFDLQ